MKSINCEESIKSELEWEELEYGQLYKMTDSETNMEGCIIIKVDTSSFMVVSTQECVGTRPLIIEICSRYRMLSHNRYTKCPKGTRVCLEQE